MRRKTRASMAAMYGAAGPMYAALFGPPGPGKTKALLKIYRKRYPLSQWNEVKLSRTKTSDMRGFPRIRKD